MTIESHRPSFDRSNVTTDYAELRADALDHVRPKRAELDPTTTQYAESVAMIARSYDYYRRQKASLSEAVDGLENAYCRGENETSNRFNKLIIDTVPTFRHELAKQRTDLQLEQYDRLGTRMPNLAQVKQEQISRVGALIQFDHQVRDVIAAGRQTFARANIVHWIAGAAGGSENALKFARTTVNGVVSELAVIDALTEEVDGEEPKYFAQFSSAQEDLRGVDISADSDRGHTTIDVKTGGSKAEPYWRDGHPHLIVRVNPEEVEGLYVDSNLRHKIRQQVIEAEALALAQKDSLSDYVPIRRKRA